MDLAIPFTGACVFICAVIAIKSYTNKNRGVIDGGAQTVVTIGVLFTFIGIAIGLYNFDTNTDKMGEQLDIFLGGMKTAFWTSIVGMLFGIIIKFFQSGVEQNEDAFIRKNLAAMDLTNTAVRDNTETLSTALNQIKATLDANSNAALQRELSKLVSAMEVFVKSSAESRADMKNLSDRMTEQSRMLEQLSKTLTKSIQDFGDSQSKNLQTLSNKIVQSGENQSARLDTMNKTIDAMRKSTETAQKNSAELLTETKTYQQQSLANDEKQAQILTDNTNKIADMKNSFDKFLKDMAENYSNELINALNKSMEKLNTQLQTQFGENFKELNAAVREVVTWQRQYKDVVTSTTEELQAINKVFTDFTQTISVNIENQISALTQNLKTFADTSKKNVEIQKNLNDAVEQLTGAVEQSKKSVQEMRTMTDNFGKFSESVLKANDTALKNYGDTITENLITLSDSFDKLEKVHHKQVEDNLKAVNTAAEKFADDIKKLQNVALSFTTDTSHYLRDFHTVSNNVMLEIRGAIEKFKTDFSAETKKSVENLNKIFETIGKNTDKQSDKAIKNLAGALAAINNQMVDNYNALMKRLAELDAVLNERRRG
ncbi:MAG: hypothetical protein IJS81_02440 [Selenomonadaceae bacterium]|nr:hypothetical protein [Selenomonadaceae bacterium]